MAHHIVDFHLDVDLRTFLDTFWFSNDFYLRYLRESLRDRDVFIGEWNDSAGDGEASCKVRDVQSHHPCKVSFPGLPSHAESTKIQRINFERESEGEITILESNSFKGIPMADYFRVDTMWSVTQRSDCIEGSPSFSVNVIITAEVVFLYSTWLRGSIESNTYSELDDVFASWKEMAQVHVQSMSLRGSPGSLPTESESTQLCVSRAAIVKMPPLFAEKTGDSQSDSEFEEFYDCLEGKEVDEIHSEALLSSPLLKYRDMLYRRRSASDHHLLTPQELMDMYDHVERGVDSGRCRSTSSEVGFDGEVEEDDSGERGRLLSGSGSDSSDSLQHKPMRRYVAITVVEILFVLAESSFWQVNRMYKYDVKELFQIEPSEVVRRVAWSFVPGKHTPLLAAPDLYGPVVAACILPQVMLIAMESTHHGCSRSSLLGDAVVVSMCLWFGLSAFYRIFGIMFAPMLNFKHCLCLTGYSLYPWIFALFLSYVSDTYHVTLMSPQLPLYALGLPAAFSQGYVFWEYTPLAFYHNHVHHLLPISLRDLSQRHRRVADSVLWYIPKALVLLVIAVTHYQFLWYVAHTFLPGRKHMCHISALLKPSNYADIISQKELRNVALDMAKKVT